MIEQTLFPHDVLPGLRRVLTRAGYHTALSGVSQDIMKEAKGIYPLALSLAIPRVFIWDAERGAFADGLLPPGLERSIFCTIILATIGADIDRAIEERFARGAPLGASLLDAWGSEAVEALVVNIDKRLREDRRPLRGSMRFAPGYGGFDIRKNALWLALAAAAYDSALPVTAGRDTGILEPRKSILCMIGWEAGSAGSADSRQTFE